MPVIREMPENSAEIAATSLAGRVLVIDDDPAIVDLFYQMLSEEGYHVDRATTGHSGLRLFSEWQHDVVLTDLRIGDMDGLDVLRTVRSTSPRTSVIILTGYASAESAMGAVRLGANDYLTKPVRALDLMKAVRHQMAAVKLADQVEELNRAVAGERDKLRRSVAELTLLKRLAERMMTVLSYVGGFEVILNLLVEEVAADVAAIYELERRTVRVSARDGLSLGERDLLADLIRTRGRELLGMELECTSESFEGVVSRGEASGENAVLASSFVAPISQAGRPMGLLVAASRHNPDFEREWSEFIAQLSSSASEFLNRIKRSVEVQRHFTASVVEHTLDGIIVLSPHSGEILVNPVARQLLDLPSGEDPSAKMVEDWMGLDLAQLAAELGSGTGEDRSARTKTLNLDRIANCRKVFLRVAISILPDEEGEPGMLLAVIHDVTPERAVEEMKNRLISNITHEVRTPTAVVKEFMSLIMDGVGGELNDTQRQYMQIMHNNIERLSRLIENLMTLARSDTGGFSVVLKPVELPPIIREVANSMAVKLKRKRIDIRVALPDGMPLIYADPDAVTQILNNLVDNAFKYSPEETEVTIGAEEKGKKIVVAVTDQGYGIAPQDQQKIFQRFQRLVDEHDPRFQEGVGLGLALVKDLVTRHGGEVWVESRLGAGSTFFFSLQSASQDSEHRPA